jgi:NADPH2:quinone reductase
VNGGGYAQYCVAEEPTVLPIPAGFDFVRAACLPEALFTLWFNVFELGALQPHETLLVHGGSSGVGTMTIQVANALGSRVLVTAGSDAKCDACRKLGAALAINYRSRDFVKEVLDATDQRGADVILDMVGGAYAERNLHALAPDGRIVHLTTRGAPNYAVALELILRKRARVTGSFMRPLPPERKARVAAALREHVWPLLGARIVPAVDSVVPLADAKVAHERIESSAHIGKIILAV